MHHFFRHISTMSGRLAHPDRQEDVACRGKKSPFKERFWKRLDGLRPPSRSRSPSRLSHRGKSPDRKTQKAENAQFTTGTHASAVPLEAKLDDNKDAQPSAKTAATTSNKDIDMWTIAEKELRTDPRTCEKLEKYDRILHNRLGSALEPIETPERRKQVLDFLDKEIERLNSLDSETRLRSFKRKAGRFFKSAVNFVAATQTIINAASSPCLPAAVACAGVTVLLSVST